MCGEGPSRESCSKICLVKVFPKAYPDRAIKTYVVLDDQSNRSLSRSDLFKIYNIKGSDSPFTLHTYAGTTEMTGRRTAAFVVE